MSLKPHTCAISRQLSKHFSSTTSTATSESRSNIKLRAQHTHGFLSIATGVPPSNRSIGKAQSFETLFLQCLLRAGKCRRHAYRQLDNQSYTLPLHQYQQFHIKRRCRRESTKSPAELALTNSSGLSADRSIRREDLKGLLDYYLQPAQPDSSLHPTSRSLEISTRVTDVSVPPPTETGTNQTTKIDSKALEHLKDLLYHSKSSNEIIQSAYEELSPPRPIHLSDATRHDLLHRFSDIERKPAEMLRYLALVSEIKDANIPLNIYEWTTATFYTARYLHLISDLSVEKAFLVWREMESQAGIRSSEATMTVLFNLAMKARKFVLAEMILEEIDRRNLPKGLHFRTSLIFYRGLRGDSQGIRMAYQELVDAGEIVSTAVISCVISALLTCGEPVAAEHVFERAKLLHEKSIGRPYPPSHWKHRRNLGKALQRTAIALRGNEQARKEYQTQVAIAPGVQAYKALIRYYAVVVGDLDRTLELINEMHTYGILANGSIFVSLFRAFEVHGGIVYTPWTRKRLEEVWRTFQTAQQHSIEDFYVGKASAIHVVKAFSKCAGMTRAGEVWMQIQSLWTPPEQDRAEIELIIEKLTNSMHLGPMEDNDAAECELAEEYEFG